MTALAIATLVTSLASFFISWVVVSGQKGSSTLQKVMFFGGLFGTVWATAFLLGAGQ